MFNKIILNYSENLFNTLSNQTNFEDIAKGRKGAILVDIKNNLIPIVRTTTKYHKAAEKFKPIHYDIIKRIREKTTLDIGFNNAMIELYDNTYCTMGFHSDQALDLELESYIAIYSCYEHPETHFGYRKLIVKNKVTGKESEMVMDHNSVILFNLQTNSEHLHKIILNANNTNNRWLGITFRLSKTFVQHINEIPYFDGHKILRLATAEETKSFYILRSKENKSLEFEYPEIDYTISGSDILEVL